MQIIVWGDDEIKEEFKGKDLSATTEVLFIDELSEVKKYGSADASFILNEVIKEEDYMALGPKPVFINSPIKTLKEMGLPKNFSRINGWPGFLGREIWEIATTNTLTISAIFKKLEWKYITVADEPGLVSARVISMIINEAYFALSDNVSSKDDIDLAMKLGTNYPYGPFEWSKKIRLERIYTLLKKLSETDGCYNSAPAMKKELGN